jgi:hypothetical protein
MEVEPSEYHPVEYCVLHRAGYDPKQVVTDARKAERERCAEACEKRATMWEEAASKPASYPVAFHDAKAAEAWSCGADIRALE